MVALRHTLYVSCASIRDMLNIFILLIFPSLFSVWYLPGNVFMYDILGKLVHNFLLLDLTTSANVLECVFWGDGIVAVTSDMQLYVAEVMVNSYLPYVPL